MVRIFLFILCCLPTVGLADERVLNHKGVYRLAPHISYLEDTTQPLLIEDLLHSGQRLRWQPNTKPEVNFGFTDKSYWFRMRLRNENSETDRWLFEIAYPLLDHIEIFLVDQHQEITKYHLTGDTYPASMKAISNPNWVFPITLKHNQSYELYVYVKNSGALQLPVRIWQWDRFAERTMVHYGLQGLFFGMVLIMALYNLMLWLSERQPLYLSYVFYISAFSLFLLSMNGLGFTLLWPKLSILNAYVLPISLSLVTSSLLYFLRDFFALKSVGRLIYMTVNFAISFHVFTILLTFVFPYNLIVKTLIFSVFSSLGLAVFITLYMLRKHHPSARYFIAAWTVFCLGGVMLLLNKIGILPINLLTENGLQFGASLEVMILSLALADKMASNQKERIRIQEDRFQLIRRLHTEKEKAFEAERQKLSLEKNYSSNLKNEVNERTKELKDILSELEQANHRLENISITDALTGLNNRRAFDESWQREYKRAHREQSSLSILILDIDFFKKVNDEYGHPAGDKCLQEVAKCIQFHASREHDITARYGGEEFSVVLPATGKEGAIEVANNIRRHVESLQIKWENKIIRLTICVGICSQTPTDTDYLGREAMLQRADKALYEAKRRGRNREIHHDDIT